ncbi:unnamed protein product [Cercospora beticola]|nr:unnamed protein product [Cercospora beticola]
MNYISREFSAVNGERSFTDDPAEALKVSFTVPQGDGVVRTGVNLLGDNQADYLDLRAVALIKNSESGSEQLLLGAAQPGLPPGDGKVNSINRKGGVTGFIAQSAIWTVNIRTFEMSAVWFNANGDKEDLSLMVASGGLFMTANPAAFPDAVTVQPVADVPDKVSACGNVNNYEYFNGACVEKCSSATVRQPNGSCKLLECPIGQMKKNGVCATCESIDLVYVPQSPYICDKACMTGYVRDPVSGVCGDGICPADQARTWENSVCQCRDLTKEKVGGTCMAKCNTALHEYRNATTKQCGCRSPDMSRSSPNSMCICAAGLEDDGWECVKECRADQFRARSGVCMCRDENAVEQNGACSTPTAPTGPAATCANAGLEYIPDAPEPCYEKCPSGQVRDPETYVCGVGLCPRPDQLRSKVTRQCVCRQSIKDIVNGVCVTNATRCIENGNEMINGDCKKKCQPALKEIRDAGTGECVCRADQSRQSLADPCKCPSGQEDDGSTCVVGSTTFSRVVFSFNIPSSMRKRQTTVDLSYGYISETMDGTGKRFLTGDVNNALKINFTLPTGTTKGEQLNFKGSGQPPEASSIPTLALILDMDNLNTGQAFGNYAHVLYFGTSRETAKGALPKEGIDNSMVFGRSREGQGKSFGPETAIWTIDTTTGFAEAYWIDKTGAKTKMIPCTSGTDLYFMPVGRTIGTELQFRAEIPGTPTPPPVGGPAECRTGTVGCPACPDRVNQCRSKEGFCVARDEVGACGYNCFPGNANAPPSADCWRCPNGYFGKSQSGCSPFPCPNPATEWRDRDGCHPNPGCTPPAVHNGYGSCVIYNTPVTVIEPTNPKVRSSTTTTTTPVGPETPEPPAPTPFD